MYSIIIADDEKIERNGLRKLIEDYFPEIELIGEVENGRDAVKLCEQKLPDIVIMDIKMPILNGIEASRFIKGNEKEIHVIISSAYSDFDYMNNAIVLGIDNYLLKPYTLEQLKKALDNTILKIEKEEQERKTKQLLDNKLKVALPLVESQFTTLAVEGNIFKEEMSSYFKIMDKDFSSGIVILFRIHEQIDFVVDNNNKREPTIKQIFNFLSGELHKEFKCALSIISSNKIALIISTKDFKKEYSVRTYSMKTGSRLCTRIGNLYKEKVDMGMSNPYKGINNLVFAYEEANKDLMSLENTKSIRQCNDIAIELRDIDRYPAHKEEGLIFAIKMGDKESCHNYIEDIFNWFILINRESDNLVNTRVYMNSMITDIQKLIIDKLKITREYDILNINVYEEIKSLDGIVRLKKIIQKSVDEAIDLLGSSHEDKIERIMDRVKKYINSHYYTEISLEDLAESVLLSPQYFSKIFKEKTGVNFVKYLTKVRMKEANRLLEETEINVSEICYKVGYNEPDYFFRVYKKYFGVTPTEYRKSVY